MPTAECLEILAHFRGQGTRAVVITGGGEPTIHPGWREIVEQAVSSHMQVGLVTNGIALSNGEKCAAGMTWVRISVIRPERAGEAEGLRRAAKSAKSTGADVGASFTVPLGHSQAAKRGDKKAVENAAAVEQTAREICQMVAEGLLTHVRFVSDLRQPDWQDMHVLRVECREAGRLPGVIWQDRSHYEEGRKVCLVSRLRPVVAADGYVYPCCGVQYARRPMALAMDPAMRMCHWREFGVDTPYFDKFRCDICYYGDYNRVLDMLVGDAPAHEEFI
jgi:organic radical activating enzyme